MLRPLADVYGYLNPGMRVLMYHRVRTASTFDQLSVTPARFAEQIEFVAKRRVVRLSDVATQLATGDRDPCVAITFDDGYLDNLTHALPILERFKVPATIFVTTTFCDQTARHGRYPEESNRLHLTWDEVRQLAAHPLIDIGSHTRTHPFLSRVSEAQATVEIAQSRAELETRLQKTVDLFCYPSGDLGAREIRLVRQAGYRAAVTVAPGLNRPSTSPFAIRRTEVTDKDDVRTMADKLSGAYDLPHHLLHWRRERRFRSARLASPETRLP